MSSRSWLIKIVCRNETQHCVGEFTQVLQDVAVDPKLPCPKSIPCTQCNHGEAVVFQATSSGRRYCGVFHLLQPKV
ncbi:hypothetical protein Ancab_013003 [Ancistrocladus abbreviatus]